MESGTNGYLNRMLKGELTISANGNTPNNLNLRENFKKFLKFLTDCTLQKRNIKKPQGPIWCCFAPSQGSKEIS